MISILVPTFNRADFLAECLDSLLAQTLPASQILVINDGSTDRTREILKSYGNRIETLETGQLGKSGALNQGLKKAKGDYVWIFDDDDVAFPDALQRFVAPLERDTRYTFSFSTFYYTATDPQTGRMGKVLRELEIPDLEKRGFLVPLLENNFLGGAALFARASCYREVGPFDPALVRSQDYDMAIRIAQKFAGIRVPGGPTFHYRQHEGERGSARDRFAGAQQLQKWLEYDRMIFRRLYREFSLDDYLPMGDREAAGSRRHALLQRLEIMATKRLIPEVLSDLEKLSQSEDQGQLSESERLIVKKLAACWHPDTGHLVDQSEFTNIFRRFAGSSKTIARLRRGVFHEILTQGFSKPIPQQMRRTFRRIVQLYGRN